MTTRIGQQINKALLDSKITKTEVDSLIKEAKANGTVSANEKKELTSFLKSAGDKFDADAKSALASFLGVSVPTTTPTTPTTSTTNPIPLANDPAVLDKHSSSVKWTKVDGGQLFKDGVSYDDVMQGQIGDCYFVGAISSVAHEDPKAIENAIKDNGDGSYTVRFFSKGVDGKMKPNYVRVDGDIPAGWSGNSTYAKSRDSKELWVTLLEKAYASWKGGYEKIGNGGYPTEVMTAITGNSSSYYATKSNTKDQLFELIQLGSEMKTPMTALTYGEDMKDMYNGTGVYAWHNYSVLGASVENGVKYVQLRNPWGSSEPGSDGKNDGIFKMKLDDFAKLYMGLNVN
ncbi:MAG: C2 family cysteine protease [Myxococcales bacterium]